VHSPEENSIRRLGILGGTFDPIHLGHIALAKLAMAQGNLDSMLLMPCHMPPHRQAAHASAKHRLAMTGLAIAGEDGLKVSEYELGKSSTSYTVETLAHFCREFPEVELFFCLGGDSLRQIKSWHRWQDIFELANLILLERDPGKVQLDTDIRARIVCSAEELDQPSGQILQLTAPTMDVSATEIRQHLLNNMGEQAADVYLQQWLHPDVLKYIREHQVYA
jgi:nicotinate-nucleotide adenylyltransferase